MASPIETSILIDTPPETVWRVLMDFERYPDWNPFIPSILGRPAVGSRLRVTLDPPGGKPMTIKPRVTVANPAREFRWVGNLVVPGLFDGDHQFILEVNDAGTRFIHREDFRGMLAGPVLKAVGESTRNGFQQMNEALKERAEQGDDASTLADHGASPDSDDDDGDGDDA